MSRRFQAAAYSGIISDGGAADKTNLNLQHAIGSLADSDLVYGHSDMRIVLRLAHPLQVHVASSARAETYCTLDYSILSNPDFASVLWAETSLPQPG